MPASRLAPQPPQVSRAIPVRTQRARTLGPVLALAGLAWVSRAPGSALGTASLGESDCARYLVGVHQWLGLGAGAHLIYGKVLSPGYYALAVALVRHLDWAPLALLSAVSVWAAVASGALLYRIGRQLTGELEAVAGAVVFLLSPAFWWLGIEPHPQGIAFLCGLAALALFLPTRRLHARLWPWTLGATVLMGAGMLLKNDLILLGAVFPALHLPQRDARRMALGCLVPMGGLGIFYAGRQMALGLPWSSVQQQTTATVAEFLTWPHGTELLKQLLPLITAPGVLVLALTGLALAWAFVRRSPDARAWRQRWGWLLAAWVAPQLGFWLLIRGNNARHMSTYILLPLWAALDWVGPRWRGARRGWALAAVCALVLGGDAVLIPASSNMTLFPSGNVPASRRDVALRTAQMQTWMQAVLQQTGGNGCFLGNYTLPYLQRDLLLRSPGSILTRADGAEVLVGTGVRFVEVNSAAQYRAAAAACRQTGAVAASLEYAPDGAHEQFFGEELGQLAILRRWYPAGAVRLRPAR